MRFTLTILALLVFAAFSMPAAEESAPGKRIVFSARNFNSRRGIPEGWQYKGRPFTSSPKYKIVTDSSGKEVLHIDMNKASGAILYDASGLLEKYPIVRWKWRMLRYPDGADGRDSDKDDQAIALYIGFGRSSSCSVAQRWETETPKNASGNTSTFLGAVKVAWTAIRNKSDGVNKWYVDEFNAAEALRKNYGKIPAEDVALSISSNSQYTGTKASAELEYIEFLPLSELGKKPK